MCLSYVASAHILTESVNYMRSATTTILHAVRNNTAEHRRVNNVSNRHFVIVAISYRARQA